MSASDNEFEQYLNELNDILVETFPTDCLDNLYLPRSIHEVVWLSCIHVWRSSLVLSTTFPVSTETIPSPSPYITFICPLLIPSSFLNSHVTVVSTFYGLRYLWSTPLVCTLCLSFHILANAFPCTLINNKQLVHGLNKFHILFSLE